MIKCNECCVLVHADCDRMLSDENLRLRYLPVLDTTKVNTTNEAEYRCPNCRIAGRRRLLE